MSKFLFNMSICTIKFIKIPQCGIFEEQYIFKGSALKILPKALPLESASFLKKAEQKL